MQVTKHIVFVDYALFTNGPKPAVAHLLGCGDVVLEFPNLQQLGVLANDSFLPGAQLRLLADSSLSCL